MSKPHHVPAKPQVEKVVSELDEELLNLVRLAMNSNVSKEQFRKFIEERSKAKRLN